MNQPVRSQPPAVVIAAVAAALAAGLALGSGGCKADDGSGMAATAPPPLANDVGPRASTPKSPAVRGKDKPGSSRAASATPGPNGVAPSAATADDDEVVARVDGAVVTMDQLQGPLVEAYGLNILLQLIQLELAERAGAEAGVEPVSKEDVAAERELTLSQMVPDAQKEDYEELLEQFLTQERISRAEFDIVLRTNAHLRKVARSLLKGQITDAQLDEAFRVMYGEKLQVRHIQAANLQEIQEARRRVEAGEPFEQVAREMSRNERTKALGGELPAFSAAAVGYPQSFKDAAFALKPGEMSDAIQAEGAYHLLLLEQRIPPKVVKFEDVKESIRKRLEENAVQATMKQLRQQLGRQALQSMTIEHAALRQQFEDKRDRRQADSKDRDEVRQQLTREREQRQQQRAADAAAATQSVADGPADAAPAGASDPAAPTPAAPAAPPPAAPDAPVPAPTTAPVAPTTAPAAAP